jgi:hypothetical protein
MEQRNGFDRDMIRFEDNLRRSDRKRMEGKREAQSGTGSVELRRYDGPQRMRSIQIKWFGPAEQVHAEQQTHQPQVVVTVKVANKNVVNALNGHLEPGELHLRALATINEKVPVFDRYKLARRKASVHRECSARSKYRDGEGHAN